MSIPSENHLRMEEYKNFQRTNLEYYPENFEEWNFARRIKDEQEKNAPITEKISKYAKTTFYKLLVSISGGDKEKAMNIKMSMLSFALHVNNNLRQLSQNKVIQGVAATVFFCLCAFPFIENYKKNSINLLTNQTNNLE
jgi:hypothetical protein